MAKQKIFNFLDKSIEYLLYLMIFFIPISIAAIEIIFTISLFLFIFKKILNPDFKFLKNPTHIFLLFFFGFCGLSLFNSGIYLAKGIKALFAKWFEYILIFIFVEDTFNHRYKIRNAVFIFLVTAILIGVDAVFQKITGIDFLRKCPLVEGHITGSFQNPNNLGAYLAPLSVLIISSLFLEQIKKQYKYILLFLVIFLCAILILSLSRGAWLGFFVGVILFLILSKNFKKAIIPLLIFILILMLFPITRQRIIYSLMPGGDADRFALFRTSWAMIKENPFLGKGLGTYMDYFRKYATIEGVYYAHNCYLQIWAESGIFSLLSFLLFIGSILYKGISLFRKNSDILLLGLLCAIIAMLVHMFFEVHLYSLRLAVLFWFILGILVAKINIGRMNSI